MPSPSSGGDPIVARCVRMRTARDGRCMSRLNGVGLPSAAVSYIAPYVTEEELLATNLLSAANGEFVVSQLKALVCTITKLSCDVF
jgi:hypothetical protein